LRLRAARRASRLTTTIQERVKLKRAQAVLIAHCCLSGSAVENAEKDGSTRLITAPETSTLHIGLGRLNNVIALGPRSVRHYLKRINVPFGQSGKAGRRLPYFETGLNYERVHALINFNGNHGQGT